MAVQGIVKIHPKDKQSKYPTRIPSKIPTKPPICPMIKVSIKNCQAIVDFFAPSDFLTPISRVLSVTETIIIFIKAIDEPRIVIIPIIQADAPRTPVISAILLAKSSLLDTPKLFSSTGFNFLT